MANAHAGIQTEKFYRQRVWHRVKTKVHTINRKQNYTWNGETREQRKSHLMVRAVGWTGGALVYKPSCQRYKARSQLQPWLKIAKRTFSLVHRREKIEMYLSFCLASWGGMRGFYFCLFSSSLAGLLVIWLAITLYCKRNKGNRGPIELPKSFLDAFSHLYKRVCPSVGRSVHPSVTHELNFWKIGSPVWIGTK